MADITTRFFLRHLRSGPTAYVHHLRKGEVAHAGVGQAFWFRPLAAALSEVPVDDREVPLVVHGRTNDFQDVTVQATVTYRIEDPVRAAGRLDFEISPDKGTWRGTPLDQLAGLLTELSQQQVVGLIARMPLSVALADGIGPVRERLATGLAGDERLAEVGVRVVDTRVLAVRAEPDVERALQTPAREQLQQDSDKATFERRALAVERERAIAENELQNQIELSRREENLVAQRGTNDRRRATEAAAASRISSDAEASRTRVLAEAEADAARVLGLAEGDAEAARLAPYQGMDLPTLVGMAARELAAHLPSINSITITPELITPLLARLAERAGNAAG
jgi:regulator of protease activity HflC (stomatin/prohibitin superfamily)